MWRENDRCSANNACGCLQFSFSDDIGICAVLGVSCSRLSPCLPPHDTCESQNHVCVRYSQCDSRPLCYPLSMADQRLCPPVSAISTTTPMSISTTTSYYDVMNFTQTTPYETTPELPEGSVVSNYSSELAYDSDQQSDSYKYYEAIRIIVKTTGTYVLTSVSNMDTYGYLYRGNFYPGSQSLTLLTTDDDNAGNRQFRITADLENDVEYTLVFTTFFSEVIGPFSLFVSGPNYVELIPIRTFERPATGFPETSTSAFYDTTEFPENSTFTYYSGELTSYSNIIPGSAKYYDAISVRVSTTGAYTFKSISNIDTYGFLYHGDVYVSNLNINLLASDDQSGGGDQFEFTIYLTSGDEYIFIFTTYQAAVIGSYTLAVSGPDYVELIPKDLNQTAITDFPEETTMGYHEVTDYDEIIFPSNSTISSYSGSLTSSSEKFFNTGKYFQAIQIIVSTSGPYNFISRSAMDTFGYLYSDVFDQFNQTANLLTSDDDGAGKAQFNLMAYLEANVSYTLIFTTYGPNVFGSFSLFASGPDYVYLTPIRTMEETGTDMPESATTGFHEVTGYEAVTIPSNSVITNYSGLLTDNSEWFYDTGKYYQAIQVIASTPGTYTFISISSMDTFGYLYNETFDPSNQTFNLIAMNDDGAGSGQFHLREYLEVNTSYTLIFTTFSSGATGSFSLVVSGPDYVYLIPIRTMEETGTGIPESATAGSQEVTGYEAVTIPSNSIITNYSGLLTFNSEQYPYINHYYQAIQVIVITPGTYNFISISSMDTFGFLYDGTFDPWNQTANLLAVNNDDAGNRQFNLVAYLDANVSYTLIFTTSSSGVTGSFSLVVSGPDHVYLIPIRTTEESGTAVMSTTESASITSHYSSALTINSKAYPFAENVTENKYYEDIYIIVKTTGFYSFKSESDIDTYAVLYQGDFTPSDPFLNKLQEDDDSGGNRQFYLGSYLESSYKYTLVATTFGGGVTGPFSVVASGPDRLYLFPVNKK